MKFNVADIKKALDMVTKDGGPVDVDIKFDAMERLIISYTDPSEDGVTITVFRADTRTMATITKTTRL